MYQYCHADYDFEEWSVTLDFEFIEECDLSSGEIEALDTDGVVFESLNEWGGLVETILEV